MAMSRHFPYCKLFFNAHRFKSVDRLNDSRGVGCRQAAAGRIETDVQQKVLRLIGYRRNDSIEGERRKFKGSEFQIPYVPPFSAATISGIFRHQHQNF
jgi:hypothetical protein